MFKYAKRFRTWILTRFLAALLLAQKRHFYRPRTSGGGGGVPQPLPLVTGPLWGVPQPCHSPAQGYPRTTPPPPPRRGLGYPPRDRLQLKHCEQFLYIWFCSMKKSKNVWRTESVSSRSCKPVSITFIFLESSAMNMGVSLSKVFVSVFVTKCMREGNVFSRVCPSVYAAWPSTERLPCFGVFFHLNIIGSWSATGHEGNVDATFHFDRFTMM